MGKLLVSKVSENDFEKTEEIYYEANVTDIETVRILLEKGFGFGEIEYITYLSTISGKSIGELANILDYEEGLVGILNELDIV